MTLRTCVALSIGTAALLWAGTASAQPAAADDGGWQAPRTPWGVPDLQGVWTNTTTTPLERPDELADREVLTDEERAELDELAVRNADQPPRERDTGAYNSFWLEKGLRTEQTSLIVAPPDGKLPAFTPAACSSASWILPRPGSCPRPRGPTSTSSTAASRAACPGQ